MYYFVESPKILNLPLIEHSHTKHVKANKDNLFICAITSSEIMIWFTPCNMLIAFHQRAENSVSIHGENCLIEWKNDSSKIVILTTKGYLIYYKVSFENEFVISNLSYAHSSWDHSLFASKSQYQNPLLSCKLTHEFSIHIQNAFKSFCCFNDEIYIPLYDGKIIKVPWTDRTKGDHFFLLLQRVYFQYEQDDDLFKIKENIYITEFELMNTDDGYICMAAVLSDGSAIYLVTDQTNTFRGIIARTHLQEKTIFHKSVAFNPLFKILAFGCKNGLAVGYNQPSDYTSLQLSHKYETSMARESSNVSFLKWSPDFRVLGIVYENGSFCLFSVFGFLLYDSKNTIDFQYMDITYNHLKTFDFGIEGYSLWSYMLSNADLHQPGHLVKHKLVKSSIISNSSMGNIEHLALNGDREVYVCLNLNNIMDMSNPNDVKSNLVASKYPYPVFKLGGNSLWQIINVPLTYIASNFPIRMSAIDTDGKYLAVAGSHGFTYYSFVSRKWKIFGNADQEKEIRVNGGILWWREFICMSCYNSVDQRDEIRFYSRNSNLDNNYAKISKTSSPVLQMNILNNLLVLFSINCRIQVINLEGGKDSTSKIILNKLIEIPTESYMYNNPYLVVSVGICPLYFGNFDDVLRKYIESNTTSIKSILVNISGNLLMFQPDIESLISIPEDLKKTKPFSSLPIMISTNVENYWVVPNGYNQRLNNAYLNLSLWLNCGSAGIKAWLTLTNELGKLEQSNRVVLNVPLKFYPLGLLINESLLVGVDSELVYSKQNTSYSQILKKTQLFAPNILEGLLRKKFDDDAKRIVLGYSYLPYFLHILELLVHKTLEEEASLSPNDNSNRLLKTVVDFTKQFPEYLKIISHCTRKSEVAFWPYLFSVVGDTKNLFQECLERKDLETAASYLVVLQNVESLQTCEKIANMLLKTSLKNCEWNLVKEIMRFLSAIDPADLENEVVFGINPEYDDASSQQNGSTPNRKSPVSRKASMLSAKKNVSIDSTVYTEPMTPATKLASPILKKNGSLENTQAVRNGDENSTTTQITSQRAQQTNRSKWSSSSLNAQSSSLGENDLSHKSIELVIYEHAHELLKKYSLKGLFEMFANLNGINLMKWLMRNQSSSLIDNYIEALTSIHFEFNWPYPFYIQSKPTNNTPSLHHEKDKKDHESESERDSTAAFDFDLIAYELANTGSSQAEKQLTYALDIFYASKCYEWVFLLALVLKKYAIANEIIDRIASNDMSLELRTSLRNGIKELQSWFQNECYGYNYVMQNIHKLN